MTTGTGADPIVRPARTGDVPAIVDLWVELQQTNTGYDRRLCPNEGAAEWYEGFIRLQLEHESSVVLVLDASGVIAGYAFGQILQRPTLSDGDCGYIGDFCVAPAFRGRGFGRRLFEDVRIWFALRGILHIEVQVIRHNPVSQAFWRKMGFDEFLRTLRTS